MRMDGKVAIVTGGTSGIGRRTVERFIEEGAKVIFTGRRAGLGAKVAAATGALFVEADAASEDDAKRVIAAATGTHGRLDILMNNAGGPAPTGMFEELPMDGFDRTMAVHVRGALAHIKHAAPVMKAAGQGSIINIGSVAGHRTGLSSSALYGIAKAAVISLTKWAAMELGEHNVRVNSISPGGIATGIFAKSMGMESARAEETSEKVKAALAKLQAIPRAGLTDDIANAAVFLASDESSFVNGDDMVVDGGLIWGKKRSEVAGGGHTWAKLFE
jgi:NAD(P)-dependent dehydrogenase (short-subunit alcohol dehydrogenase family)